MGECCTHCSECDRKKVRDEKEYKDLIHRLSRIEARCAEYGKWWRATATASIS